MSQKSNIHKYQRVEEYLVSMIAENNYPPGTLLPSEPALCKRFRVSRNTVRQAIGNLINEGLIYNEHGKGTFVAIPQIKSEPFTNHHEIGIVLNSLTDLQQPFFSEYLRGIEEEIGLHECSIHLIFNRDLNMSEINLSREEDVLGLVLIGSNINDPYIFSLQKKRIPFVWFTTKKTTKKVPYIYLDKSRGLYLVVDHLVKLGHSEIGYIAGNPLEKWDYEEKLRGFLHAMKEFQVPICKKWIKDGFYTKEGAEKAIRKIWDGKDRPTSLVVANDVMALSVMEFLNKKGIQIPNDISVVGFDDITESAISKPPLTTVHVPMTKMGHEAAKILFQMIEKKDTTMIYQVTVEPELVIRSSSAFIKNHGNGR